MKESTMQAICGPGKGRATSTIDREIGALTKGSNATMVQFLKGSMDMDNMEIIERLESEFKILRFEKPPIFFNQLSGEEKEEARTCIHSGVNFAKKVLVTGECDILILDKILGILDEGVVIQEELYNLISQARQFEIRLILTGNVYPQTLGPYMDEITRIQTRYRQ